ncbi:MAG: hypothetical protein ACJZ5P_03935 [Candidatus Thalassarchaeaceae archaeon]
MSQGCAVEEYLLDCLEILSRSGDHEATRKKKLTNAPSWSLLQDPSWKALAMIAASKEALDAVGTDDSQKKNRSRRIGRRGGRGKIRTTSDKLASPDDVITSEFSCGYRLAVLIAQKNRFSEDDWSRSWDLEMDSIREECRGGIHPVWERLARESPLLAEMGLFPIVKPKSSFGERRPWIDGSKIDYSDNNALRDWLTSVAPFKLSASQLKTIQKIEKDLRKNPRRNLWEGWMTPSLTDMEGDASLLEGLLLAAAGSDRARDVLEGVEGECAEVAGGLNILISLREGVDCDWNLAVEREGEDKLSSAIKMEGWLRVDLYPKEMSLELAMEGVSIIESGSGVIPNRLAWIASGGLVESGDFSAALKYIEGKPVNDLRGLTICLSMISEDSTGISLESIVSGLAELDEECLRLALSHPDSPSLVRTSAASILSNIDQIRYTDEIISSFTMFAEIKGLTDLLIEEVSLQRAYPFRVMLSWHLITADDSVGVSSKLLDARRVALASIEDAERDGVLSDVCVGLISLLDGISSNLGAVHDKLDSDGLKTLKEVRMALGPEGDGIVKEVRIDKLVNSVNEADLTLLERRLFEAVINSLILNRAAIDLQNGDSSRREQAVSSLESVISVEGVSMRTVRFASDLVFEHSVGIESLDSWYRENESNSPESQIVKAALLERSGDLMGSAWAYKDAAARLMETDIEKSAIFLRWSLISFAHGGGWKEAVALIDAYPTLSASVTNRFKMYLNVCKDHTEKNQVGATSRIIEHVSNEHRNGDTEEDRASIIESLESIKMYPIEHGLPIDPFQGRVMAAIMKMSHSSQSRRSDLERRFDSEMRARVKDTFSIVTVIEQVAEISPIRALRMFERALKSGEFEGREEKILRNTQRNLFTRQAGKISVRERKTLGGLGLKPLILVDTNILIDALKDDLLMEISPDSLGSLDWTMQRAFHWKLRSLAKEGRVLLNIPQAAMGEFMNRVKSPDVVLKLFENVYIERASWKKAVTKRILEERVSSIISIFNNWEESEEGDSSRDIDLEGFLSNHREIFRVVDQHKREHKEDIPARTEIEGEAIYPEKGDCDIMKSAAIIADSFSAGVGSVVVATRDSDFKLVSRALEEEFGFGVIGGLQQLNKLAYLVA